MPRRLIDNEETFKTHLTNAQITALRKVIQKHSRRKSTYDALILSYPKASAKDKQAIDKILNENALEMSIHDNVPTIHERFNIREEEDEPQPAQPQAQPQPAPRAGTPRRRDRELVPVQQPQAPPNGQLNASLVSAMLASIMGHPWIAGLTTGSAITLYILKCAMEIFEARVKQEAYNRGLETVQKGLVESKESIMTLAQIAKPMIIEAVQKANVKFDDAKNTVKDGANSFAYYGFWTGTTVVACFAFYKIAQLAHLYFDSYLNYKKDMAKTKAPELEKENEELKTNRAQIAKDLEESRQIIRELRRELRGHADAEAILQRETEILGQYVPEAVAEPQQEEERPEPPPQAVAEEPQPQQPQPQRPRSPSRDPSRSVSRVAHHGEVFTRREFEGTQAPILDARAQERQARMKAIREQYQ